MKLLENINLDSFWDLAQLLTPFYENCEMKSMKFSTAIVYIEMECRMLLFSENNKYTRYMNIIKKSKFSFVLAKGT